MTNYYIVDGDYNISTAASTSTENRLPDVATSIRERYKCVCGLYSKRVRSCGHQ